MEPGTAEPHVCDPIDLRNFQGFLVLMSDGLYEAYEAWTRHPSLVNQDIAHLIANEIKQTTDIISVVAQNVVEKVKKLFCTTCQRDQCSGQLDDITLIVRNFGFDSMAMASHTLDFSSGELHPRPGYIQSVQPMYYSNYPGQAVTSHQPYTPTPMSIGARYAPVSTSYSQPRYPVTTPHHQPLYTTKSTPVFEQQSLIERHCRSPPSPLTSTQLGTLTSQTMERYNLYSEVVMCTRELVHVVRNLTSNFIYVHVLLLSCP